MIDRSPLLKRIQAALRRSRVVMLLGPRQCGKTTLARELVDESSINYFDLEDPASLARLEEPMTALRSLKGLVGIDEVQRRPDLFPALRVLADRKNATARFLILGSASGALLRQSSESLAGRVEQLTIGGFSIRELGAPAEERLWRRGGFPLAYLAKREADSTSWRKNFIRTVLAHYHGQTWSAAEPARALGVNESTMRRYLDLLTDALMVRQLQPWYANLGKRQVKSPRIYVRDSGLLHQLLGIDTEKQLLSHPKVGASWEGFVIEQVLATEPHDDAFFWSTHQGIAPHDLELERVAVLYPGDKRYPHSETVEAVPLSALTEPSGLFR